MKILITSAYHISNFLGGNEQYTHELALGLTSIGHQVTYLTGNTLSQFPTSYELLRQPLNHIWGKPLPSIAYILQAHKTHPDLVHSSGHDLTSLVLAMTFWRTPKVLTYHADNHSPHFVLQLLNWFIEKLIPYMYATIITTSPSYQKSLQKKWPRARVVMVPLMLPKHILQAKTKRSLAKQNLDFDPKRLHILYVSKLSSHQYYKGLEVLFHSLKLLPQNFVLHIVGDGDQFKYFVKLSQELRVFKRCIFHGRVANGELAQYYQAADVFVLPSTSNSEGFGLVLLEAMYLGTPTITTTAIGPAEWFRSRNITTFVAPNDSSQLANAILKRTIQIDQNQLMRAQKFAAQFTREQMIEKTNQLYKKLRFKRTL